MKTNLQNTMRVASYSRYSTNLQDESSLEQQQNRCREKAVQLGMAISPDLEFFDSAVSGTKPDRIGVNDLINAAESGLIDVIIVDSLSRLSREVCFTMSTLKNLIMVNNIRFISVSECIDSAQGNWELISMILGFGNQEHVKILRSSVIRGQSHAHMSGYSTGTYPFGYESVPKEGTEFGRQKKLRSVVEINEEKAQWVRKIFEWFLKDKMPIQKIVKELTKLEVTKDHRSSVSHWSHQSVAHMLSNKYYTGVCSYGKKTNIRNPLTGKISQKLRPAEESGKWITFREDLRIIDQETFDQVQEKLEENRARYASKRGRSGRFTGPTNDFQNPRHQLQGLFVCSKCNSPFITQGFQYMQCKGHKNGLCDVKTCLPRALAKKIILKELQRSLGKNEPLTECLFEALKKSIEIRKTNKPDEIESLTKNLKAVTSKINRLLDLFENLKDGDPEGQKDLQDKIKARTQEKKLLEKQLDKIAGSSKKNVQEPTLQLIQDKLDFIANAIEGDALSKITWTKILGNIELMEVDTIGHERKHFAGFLKLETSRLLNLVDEGSKIISDGCDEEMLLDFIDEPEWITFKDRILELHSKKMKHRDIAKALGCPRGWVTLALKHHAEESGTPYVDGRKLKKRLGKLTVAMKIADQAKALMDKGWLLQEIAKELGCCKDTITSAVKHWHTSRELPVPDGRTRRKSLERKSSKRGND